MLAQISPSLSRNEQLADFESALIASKSDDYPVVCLMAKYAKTKGPKNSRARFIDSGCWYHMTFNKSLFSSFSPGHHSEVEHGNSNTADVAGTGCFVLELSVNGSVIKSELNNVLHVPDLGYQLLSVSTLDRSGLTTCFGAGQCKIHKNSILFATGTMSGICTGYIQYLPMMQP